MSRETVKKTFHLSVLDKDQHKEVMDRVSVALDKLGLEPDEYNDMLENAQDGRLCDLEDLISLEGFKTLQIK